MPATHLTAEIQSAALALRLDGQSYLAIARSLGLRDANAAMYAAERGAITATGSTDSIRRYVRTNTTGSAADTDMLFLNRNFGVEVEYNQGTGAYPGSVQRECEARGLSCYVDGYNHAVQQTSWRSTTDATVTGGELVSPILNGEAGFAQVKTAYEAVKAAGGTVAQNTGGHVHHDVNDLDRASMVRLVNNLERTQRALLAYVPAHRYNGHGSFRADVVSAGEFDRVRQWAAGGRLDPRSNARGRDAGPCSRYKAFNFNAILVYGTVEFRAHGGCLTPFTMRCWIAVGQAIIAWSKAGGEFSGTQTVDGMLDTLVAAGMLKDAMRTRYLKRVAEVAARASRSSRAA